MADKPMYQEVRTAIRSQMIRIAENVSVSDVLGSMGVDPEDQTDDLIDLIFREIDNAKVTVTWHVCGNCGAS